MPAGALSKVFSIGKLKVVATSVNGPASYQTGGFTVAIPELNQILYASVVLQNNRGDMVVTYSISGNQITIQVWVQSADTTTGAISVTELAAGQDLSTRVFQIIAIGY